VSKHQTDAPTVPKVLAWATNPACALYRLQAPLGLLARNGSIELNLVTTFDQATFERVIEWADTFIIQRARVDDTLADVIAKAKQQGVRVIYEIDDDLLALADTPTLCHRMSSEDLHQIERGLRETDAIHVSTDHLARRYAQFGETVLLPNYFPLDIPPLRPPSATMPMLKVFYGGGSWHEPDWKRIEEPLHLALREVANTTPIEVRLMGATWSVPASDERLSYHVLPPAPWPHYLEEMGQADLALMPVDDNPHTAGKSPIKFYEAAAMGAPALALGRVYSQVIEQGRTGFCAETPEEFARSATEILSSPELRAQLRAAAHRWLVDHALLADNLSTWREALTYTRATW